MCLNHHKLEFLFSGYSTFIASCRLFFQPQRLLQTQVGNEKYTMCACRCPMTDPSWSRITFRVFQGGSVQISNFLSVWLQQPSHLPPPVLGLLGKVSVAGKAAVVASVRRCQKSPLFPKESQKEGKRMFVTQSPSWH